MPSYVDFDPKVDQIDFALYAMLIENNDSSQYITPNTNRSLELPSPEAIVICGRFQYFHSSFQVLLLRGASYSAKCQHRRKKV